VEAAPAAEEEADFGPATPTPLAADEGQPGLGLPPDNSLGEVTEFYDLETKQTIRSGEPVTFNYARNNTPAFRAGATFQQDIEPAGRYLSPVSKEATNAIPSLEYGEITFKSPLVLEWRGYGEDGWKKRLSSRFGGKKGKALSKAIAAAGYDGIITVSPTRGGQYATETVDLRMFKPAAQPSLALPPAGQAVTPAQDAEYMAAVEAGDMAKAQAMVDEAAKKAGYADKKYHGTGEDFNVFKHVGTTRSDHPESLIGWFFTPDEEVAAAFARQQPQRGNDPLATKWGSVGFASKNGRVIEAYLKLRNTLPIKSNLKLAGAIYAIQDWENVNQVIADYKKRGMFAVGLDGDGDVSLPEFKLSDSPLLLIVGSEGKGLSRLVSENCDQIVSIPISAKTESLNAGIAVSVALYKIASSR
jgi:hypothetical protein